MESSAKDAARQKFRTSQRNRRGRGGRHSAVRSGSREGPTLDSNADRYSEDEGTVQTTAEPLPPAERAQRSKGADLADLLKETFADDSFTVSRYRHAEEPLPELPPDQWSATSPQALELDVGALVACLQSIPVHRIMGLPEQYGANFEAKTLASDNNKQSNAKGKPGRQQSAPEQQPKPAQTQSAASSRADAPPPASSADAGVQQGPAAASTLTASPNLHARTKQVGAKADTLQTPSMSAQSTAGVASLSAASPASPSGNVPHQAGQAQAAGVQSVEDAELDALLAMPSVSSKPSQQQRHNVKPPAGQHDDSFEAFLQTL